jgi:hypothetical protein
MRTLEIDIPCIDFNRFLSRERFEDRGGGGDSYPTVVGKKVRSGAHRWTPRAASIASASVHCGRQAAKVCDAIGKRGDEGTFKHDTVT